MDTCIYAENRSGVPDKRKKEKHPEGQKDQNAAAFASSAVVPELHI